MEMVASFWRNRTLIATLVRREVLSRYRGSFMGILWSFFNPIFMLLVYTFVFGVIFKSRWNTASDSKAEFALSLFVGLLMFNLFSECVNRAPGLILGNVNYVKKVVFPLEILSWVAVGAALFHWFISLAVWIVFYIFVFGVPHASALLIPLILIPFVLMVIGFTWTLASLGVYLRDIAQFIAIITSVLMFLAPIFYPITAVPEKYRYLLLFNPLTPAVEGARDVLFSGTFPNLVMYLVYLLVSMLVAWLGFAWFQKTRKGFSDAL